MCFSLCLRKEIGSLPESYLLHIHITQYGQELEPDQKDTDPQLWYFHWIFTLFNLKYAKYSFISARWDIVGEGRLY